MKTTTSIVIILLTGIVMVLVAGCKKDNDQAHKEPVYVKNDSLQQNVSIVKTGDATLKSDSAKEAQGIYELQFNGTPTNYKAGDVVIGQDGQGYLRKVTNSSVNGNSVTLQTSQATLEDLFSTAQINFQLNLSNKKSATTQNVFLDNTKVNYIAEGVNMSDDGFSFNFSNTPIYQIGPLSFQVTSGNVTFNPNYVCNIIIDHSTVNKIAFYADNANLNIDCGINITATQGVNLADYSKQLADVEKTYTVWAGGIPIIVVVNTKLIAHLTTSVSASLNINTGFTNNYKITLGTVYENNTWTGKYDLTPTSTPKPFNYSGTAKLSQNFTITPEVTVKLYGVAGPYFKPEIWEQFDLEVASPSLDWDALLKVGINTTVGADITIFGKTLANFSKTYSADKELWNAPAQLNKISGDNQSGDANQALAQPLTIKVTDNLNNPISNVVVYFDVSQGGGSVDHTSILTDANGFAETIWTLGEDDNQEIMVQIKKADGSDITGSPLTFTASAGNDTIFWLTNGSSKTWSLYSDGGEILPTPYWKYYYITFNINGTANFLAEGGDSTDQKIITENHTWSIKNGSFCIIPNCKPIDEISPDILSFDGAIFKPKTK
jgi:hypothetical protein